MDDVDSVMLDGPDLIEELAPPQEPAVQHVVPRVRGNQCLGRLHGSAVVVLEWVGDGELVGDEGLGGVHALSGVVQAVLIRPTRLCCSRSQSRLERRM